MRGALLWMLLVCVSGEVPPCSVGPALTVSQLRKVSVPCPPVLSNSSEIKYQLLFNRSLVNQIRLSEVWDAAGSLFSAQFEVSVNSSGQFVCSRQRFYPPPYMEACLSTAVTVSDRLPEGTSSPALNVSVPAANQSRPFRSMCVPQELAWAGCVVLLVYSLSITCIAVLLWRKLKRDEEDTNEYVNTKPKELRKPC